jgi:hypothetical protein
MKPILATMIFAAALTVLAGDAKKPPGTREELLRRFQDAANAKDKNAIMGLFDWQGVSPDARAAQEYTVSFLFDQEELDSIALAPASENYRLDQQANSVRLHPNIPVLGVVDVKCGGDANPTEIMIPYGETNAVFYLAAGIADTNSAATK